MNKIEKKYKLELIKNIIEKDKIDEVKILLQEHHFLKLDKYLVYACLFGKLEIVKLLVEYGGKMNTYYGEQCIDIAVSYGYLDIVKFLTGQDIIPEQRAEVTFSTIVCASHYHQNEILEYLVTLPTLHIWGPRALELMIRNGHIDTAGLLLYKGIKPSEPIFKIDADDCRKIKDYRKCPETTKDPQLKQRLILKQFLELIPKSTKSNDLELIKLLSNITL